MLPDFIAQTIASRSAVPSTGLRKKLTAFTSVAIVDLMIFLGLFESVGHLTGCLFLMESGDYNLSWYIAFAIVFLL